MRTITAISGRIALLMLVWWALSEGDRSGLGTGLVIAVLVTAISWRLFPQGAWRIRPLPLFLFMLFFLGRSVTAGMDVARRLLSPSLPVNPGYLSFTLSLPGDGPRWLLANTLSLMPGTLSVNLRGDQLELHCLDTRNPVESDVREAERRVAKVFGLPLLAGSENPEAAQ